MAAFRIYSKIDTFWGQTGQLLSGGQLRFFDAGAITPRNVFGNEELTVNNGSTVTLDSSGRPNVDVWGSGEYFVELYDAQGVKQGEADDVQEQGAASASIPAQAGNSGKFLSTNGTSLTWQAVRQVPDPTGQTGKILGNDGVNLIWRTAPVDGAPGASADIVVDATSVIVGDGTDRMRFLTGTGSASASGGRTTSVAITFASAFAAAPVFVGIMPTISVITGVGYAPVPSATNITTTGFTANFDVNADQSGANISVPVTFQWVAIGDVA